eukprot:TRINITY_DN2391_c0_g1_i3.p1 TRINITY_DN2391_c0_g1~~TRINITY_DN2391_c0_g1_i3.p1  ORF type:complete len:331 (+),score=50.29 TRINITY_DN2391_c0_g1_i3:100-1092(+)
MGLIIFFVVMVLANYTGKLLIKCAHYKNVKNRTYASIGEAAFGSKGRIVSVVFQHSALIGVAILYIILAAINFQSLFHGVFPHLSVRIYMLVTFVISLPFILFMKTLKEISWIAFLGIFASGFLVVAVVILSSVYMPKIKLQTDLIHIKGLPFAFSTITFSFALHNTLNNIERHMKNPQNFNKMINASFLFVLFLYIPLSVIGYIAYGNNVKDVILLNLPVNAFSIIATILINIHVFVVIPILLNPVFIDLQESFFPHYENNKELIARTIMRFVIFSFCLGVALLTGSYFGDFMSLISSLCTISTVYILPSVFYLKLNYSEIKKNLNFFG